MESWADTTLDALHASGLRRGGARSAVIELLDTQTCCVSAQEIADELRTAGNAVGVASIYRVLDLLEERGFLQRIDAGDGIARYEAKRGPHHHHHLVCADCGRVRPFEDETLERAIHGVEHNLGVEVDAHEVLLRGRCTDCTS